MIAAILIFLAWGSYLNSLGHRLLDLEHFFKLRSFCPQCYQQINWYDNIPLFSWLYLAGKCRACKKPISWLYPFIEIITPISLYLLSQKVPAQNFAAYFLFFSALIITIRTDFDHMLISRFATTYLIPVGLICAYYNLVPISFVTSCNGILFGYSLLWVTQQIHIKLTGHDGLGQGDLELLAFIGAFTGPFGCWISVSVGSIFGTIITLCFIAITHTKIAKIPFGSYLALGAMIFILYQELFITYFFSV